MSIVNVYCDGSISETVMIDPFQSQRSREYVGRLIVLIPTCDLGLIEQTRLGILTPRGTTDNVFVEALAIYKAIEVCKNHVVGEFVVFSDCEPAIATVNDPRVCWASRKDTPSSAYFKRVWRRAAYLRQSEGRVKKRQPSEPHQLEIFELLQAEYREFRLSQSPLWTKILKDKKYHHRTNHSQQE
jgi:hypothetical protein